MHDYWSVSTNQSTLPIPISWLITCCIHQQGLVDSGTLSWKAGDFNDFKTLKWWKMRQQPTQSNQQNPAKIQVSAIIVHDFLKNVMLALEIEFKCWQGVVHYCYALPFFSGLGGSEIVFGMGLIICLKSQSTCWVHSWGVEGFFHVDVRPQRQNMYMRHQKRCDATTVLALSRATFQSRKMLEKLSFRKVSDKTRFVPWCHIVLPWHHLWVHTLARAWKSCCDRPFRETPHAQSEHHTRFRMQAQQ